MLRAVLLGGALYLAPAMALASWIRGGGALRRYGLAALLSPVALGVTLLPLRLLGMASLPAGLAALAAWCVAALAGRRALPGRLDAEELAVLRRCAWFLPLVLLPPLLNPYLQERADAWFHAAVTFQVRNLPLPPQDPYYAGLRLQYFWFYHLVLSAWSAVAGIGPFPCMWLFNCVYFAGMLVGVYYLARRTGASHEAALWAPGLAALGANPLGWGWVPVHLILDPGGWANLARQLPDYARNLTVWGYSSTALAFSLNKYLVGTAFSWGLTLSLWWILDVADYVMDGRRAGLLVAGALSAAILCVHMVSGFNVYLAGAGTLALAWLLAPSTGVFRRTLGLAGAMALALALVSPYLLGVLHGKSGGGMPLVGLNGRMLWTIAWVGLGVLPFALLGAGRVWRAGGAGRWVLLMTAGTLAMSALLSLNLGDEGKFLNLALYLLSALGAPAAWAWSRRRFPGRRKRAAALALFYGPTPAILLVCTVLSHGAAEFRPRSPRAAADELRLYQWVRRSTPVESLVLASPGSLEPMVRAERAQVWSLSTYAKQWQYPEAAVAERQAAVEAAFGAGLGPRELGFLAALRRPVYRLSLAGEAPAQPCFVEEHREGAWSAERLVIPPTP